jgi:hypothetical protein
MPRAARGCLASLAACEPRPDEVLEVARAGMMRRVGRRRVRVRRGARARVGRREQVARPEPRPRAARHDAVLVMDDDCTVAPSWIGVAWRQLERDPEAGKRTRPARTNAARASQVADPVQRRPAVEGATPSFSVVRLEDLWLDPSNDSRPGSSSTKLIGRGRGSGRCQRGDRPGSRAAL